MHHALTATGDSGCDGLSVTGARPATTSAQLDSTRTRACGRGARGGITLLDHGRQVRKTGEARGTGWGRCSRAAREVVLATKFGHQEFDRGRGRTEAALRAGRRYIGGPLDGHCAASDRILDCTRYTPGTVTPVRRLWPPVARALSPMGKAGYSELHTSRLADRDAAHVARRRALDVWAVRIRAEPNPMVVLGTRAEKSRARARDVGLGVLPYFPRPTG